MRGYTPGAQNLSNATTSYMISGILCWLFQLCLFSPDSLNLSPFALSWFEGIFMPRESVAWMRISAGLPTGQTLVPARRLKRNSAHYANLLSAPLPSPGAFITALSHPAERSQGSYWRREEHMTSCVPSRPRLVFFLILFLYGYWVFGSMWEGNRDKKNRKAKVNSLLEENSCKILSCLISTAGESCVFLLRDALDRDVKHTGK